MTFAPGDVVRVRNGEFAVVLIARDMLTTLPVRGRHKGARRCDVVLTAGCGLENPVVRCERTMTIRPERVEKVGSVGKALLAMIAAAYLKERAVRATEERFFYCRVTA